MATHFSILAWRIPGMAEPGGLPSMGSHRIGQDWSDVALGSQELAVPSVHGIFRWEYWSRVPFPPTGNLPNSGIESTFLISPALAGGFLPREPLALLTMPKPLTVWTTTNCIKFFKRWEYQTTLPASWEICMQVKKQQLELDMEQQTGSKLGKENVKAVYCHLAYLTSMQSTSWEVPGWLKHKLESRLLGEISIPQICRWHHSYGRKKKGTKESLDESERGEWKRLTI